MAKRKAADDTIDLAVAYGDVSLGEKTCRVGVTLSRDQLSLSKADATLCGRRLIGRITAKENAEHGDQGNLDGFDDPSLNGIFDIKRIGITPKEYSFGLTFSIEDVQVELLAKFAQRAGRLLIESTEAIPEKSRDENGDEE